MSNTVSNLITVSTAAEGASDWSDLAELSNGRTVHVWHDGGDKDGSAAGIFARILDSNFQRVGDEFQVNTDTYNFQTKARIAAIKDGNFLITWSGGDGTLQGQIYDQQGTKVNSQFQIAPWFVGEADLFVVDGKFWVLRSQANEDAGVLAIYEADGTEISNDIKLSTNLGSELRISELGNSRYIIVSYDNKNTTTSGDDPDIYAQIVDASANLIGSQITLNASIENDQKAPEVVSTGDGGFAVVWQEESSSTSWDIYFRMYDGAGQAVSDPLLINTTTLGEQIKPYIEHSPTGGYLVTWESNHLGASEVFYQELSNTAAKIGSNVLLSVDANGTAVHGTDATMQRLSNGNVVAEWDSQGNVYARVFTKDDVLTDGAGAVTINLNDSDGTLTADEISNWPGISGTAPTNANLTLVSTYSQTGGSEEFELTVAADGSWTLTEDEVGYLPYDGTYSLSLTSKDSSGNSLGSATAELTFATGNTLPDANNEQSSDSSRTREITLANGDKVEFQMPDISDVLDLAKVVDQWGDELVYEATLPGDEGASRFSSGNYLYESTYITNETSIALVYSGERYTHTWGYSVGASMVRFYDLQGNQTSEEIIFTDQTDQGHRPGVYAIDDKSYLLLFQTNNPIGMPRLDDMVGYVVGRVIDAETFQMEDTFVVASNTNLLVKPPSISRGLNGEIEISWKEYDLTGAYLEESFTKFGGDISDKVFGSEKADILYGFGGDDQIDGLGGEDVIDGGEGADTLEGGDGDDIVDGGVGNDLIIGGNGLGDDIYYGGEGVDTVKYTSATSGILVDLKNGVAKALSDDASIGEDQLYEIENIIGGKYSDKLLGDDNDNEITTFGGDDTVISEGGDDVINTFNGANDIRSGTGSDTINLSSDEVFTSLYAHNVKTDKYLSLIGKTKYSSVIDGDADADTIILMDSSNGDALFLHDAYSDIHESVSTTADDKAMQTAARVISVETIIAGDGDDIIDLTSNTFDMDGTNITLKGEAGDDVLWAAEGNDTLQGGTGDDTLFGGDGNDILTGGDGADIFEFVNSAASQTDTITDYTSDDTLKFYLNDGDRQITEADYQNGTLTWGNLTIAFEDRIGTGSDNDINDLFIVYV